MANVLLRQLPVKLCYGKPPSARDRLGRE